MKLFNFFKKQVPELTTGQQVEEQKDELIDQNSNLSREIAILKHDERYYTCSCKIVDDQFYSEISNRIRLLEYDKLDICNKLDDLNQEIIRIVNTFPMYKPCIPETIAKELDLNLDTVLKVLIYKSEFGDLQLASKYIQLPIFNEDLIENVEGIFNHIIKYSVNYHSNASTRNIYTVSETLNNWRFVVSRHVVYFERIE